jgi:predicted enzyme related to lactoylglutathione lyase
MVERFKESGQIFEGPVTHDRGDRSVYLSDPEGNRVELWDVPNPASGSIRVSCG